MEFKIKSFSQLDGREVYEIMRARSAVFQLEEGIRYLDADRTDYGAMHCFIEDSGEIVAYLRAYTTDSPEEIKIGRVLTTRRNQGFGKELLSKSIDSLKKMNFQFIRLDSQEHAVGFYIRLGFRVCSETFLEEGIPHVKMELKISDLTGGDNSASQDRF